MRRCKPCWEKHINRNIATCVANPKEQRNLARAMRPDKRPRERSNTTKSRKKIVKCKWCGATTHKTKRSKQCPYNGSTLTSPPSVLAETDVESGSTTPDAALAETDVESGRTTPDEEGSETTPVGSPTALFHTGDTVLSLWSRRKWITAHVTGFAAGKYSVYFPDSGIVRNAVPPEKVKEYKVSRNGLPVSRRGGMINKTFYDDGVGNKDEPRRFLFRRVFGWFTELTAMSMFVLGHLIVGTKMLYQIV